MGFEQRQPEVSQDTVIELSEGKDFVYASDLYEVVADIAQEAGITPDTLLLCGHSDKDDTAERTSTFAYSYAEILQEVHNPVTWTPFEYAIDNAEYMGGNPVLSVFDASKLIPDPSGENGYLTLNGESVDVAKLFTIKLSLW